MAAAVPIVDYLVLGDDPHLVAKECTGCGARFFDRRNACAACSGTECGGTSVRGNVINVEPDPEHVKLGMKVKLATYVVGTDDDGTEAIGFGFEPIEN
jgi:uncharacterized protein